MAYSISFSPQAVKDLEDLDRFVRKKLIATIEKLEESPQFYGKRLQNISLWSLRSGKYRIIFEIDDKSEEVCSLEECCFHYPLLLLVIVTKIK